MRRNPTRRRPATESFRPAEPGLANDDVAELLRLAPRTIRRDGSCARARSTELSGGEA